MGSVPYSHHPRQLYGDPSALFWYGQLKSYCRRFEPDIHGFVRIHHGVVMDDTGISRRQIKYLNSKLVAAGVLIIDDKHRGKRIPTGYKLKML